MTDAETQARIVAAGRRLIAEGSRPTAARVATAAGVSRTTFYRISGGQRRLLAELEVAPDPGTRDRILEAALRLIGRDGLAGLSMDGVAVAAGVSRASLYRLFPGKPSLFREVIRAFSPMETLAAAVESAGERPVSEVMPELARAVARELRGNLGVVRTLLVETTGLAPDTEEAREYALTRGIGSLMRYLVGQMVAGSLRPTHPLLALQAFAGPLLIHVLTRELAERHLGLDTDIEDAAAALAEIWVRGMAPEEANR